MGGYVLFNKNHGKNIIISTNDAGRIKKGFSVRKRGLIP